MIDYARLATACRTQNEYNRLHIKLESVLCPPEIAAIRATGIGASNAFTSAWLARLEALHPTLFIDPQRFQRKRLSRRITRYSDPGSRTARKQIVVAFAGAAKRVGMPIALFLQSLDCRDRDVFLLNRDPGRSYLSAWNDNTPDLRGILSEVERVGRLTDYAGLAVIGNSAGGVAAILASCLLGADVGVSFSGTASESQRDTVAGLLANTTHRPRLTFMHCAGNERDSSAGGLMHAMFAAGEVVSVAGCDSHNVAAFLLREGRHARILERLLSRDAVGPVSS